MFIIMRRISLICQLLSNGQESSPKDYRYCLENNVVGHCSPWKTFPIFIRTENNERQHTSWVQLVWTVTHRVLEQIAWWIAFIPKSSRKWVLSHTDNFQCILNISLFDAVCFVCVHLGTAVSSEHLNQQCILAYHEGMFCILNCSHSKFNLKV